MSASPVPRPVIRCSKCGLNQFDRAFCGKCKKDLHPQPPQPPQPIFVVTARMRRALYGAMLGDQIKRMRLHSGLSQYDLAEIMGIPRQYISKVEHGRLIPILGHIVRFADGLGCNAGDLMPGPLSTDDFMGQVAQLICGVSEAGRAAVLAEAERMVESA